MPEVPFSPENLPPLTIDRHDQRILDRLESASAYQKHVEVAAVVAPGGEVVTTRLADGTLETEDIAEAGSIIVTNPGGEQYILSANVFADRYNPKPGQEGVYEADGYSKVINNFYGQPITMLASWGEMQFGDADCMIAARYDHETGQIESDPYLIGRDEFNETYRPAT